MREAITTATSGWASGPALLRRRPGGRHLAIVAAAAPLAFGAPACGTDDLSVEDSADENGAELGDDEQGDELVDEDNNITVTVSEGCAEVWFEDGDAQFRSRAYPADWRPGESVTGTVSEVDEEGFTFEAADGSGTAEFSGGVGASFTMDCPLHPDDQPAPTDG